MRRLSGTKPVSVIVEQEDGKDLVLELRPRTVMIRPIRSRDPEARVVMSWSSLYRHGLLARTQSEAPIRRRRKVKRGLLSLGG